LPLLGLLSKGVVTLLGTETIIIGKQVVIITRIRKVDGRTITTTNIRSSLRSLSSLLRMCLQVLLCAIQLF